MVEPPVKVKYLEWLIGTTRWNRAFQEMGDIGNEIYRCSIPEYHAYESAVVPCEIPDRKAHP